jgi:subtilisin family serine protease
VDLVPGLAELWRQTRGDRRITIALLDGPVDLQTPTLAGSGLMLDGTSALRTASAGPAMRHGTRVASLVFGQSKTDAGGIAPGCNGLVVPIFHDLVDGCQRPCSELDLARALLRALTLGAHVINVSAGRFSSTGKAHPLLADALRRCAARGAMVVAAAGNDGCPCLHVPAAIPTVLAVGAHDAAGRPMAWSNWGSAYATNGLLAPGADLPCEEPGGKASACTGSSYASAVVAGVAGLLLSLALARGRPVSPRVIRKFLLDSADPCIDDLFTCRRYLAGRLNSSRATASLLTALPSMSEEPQSTVETAAQMGRTIEDGDRPLGLVPTDRASAPLGDGVAPSACGCPACAAAGGRAPLVFALGEPGYDLVSEARRDSIRHHMDAGKSPEDPKDLLAYLTKNPWEAAAITWTLRIDQTVIYALTPSGPFATHVYDRLRGFLSDSIARKIDLISVPGRIVGQTTLFDNQVVPTIEPDLRELSSWLTEALIKAVAGPEPPATATAEEKAKYKARVEAIHNFLARVYYELRNLGVTAAERAINYAATNAFNIGTVYHKAIQDEMELDTIEVERSPICRPHSNCWDVKLLFFDPEEPVQSARRVFRFTVDVSDIVPVMVGPVRSWAVR